MKHNPLPMKQIYSFTIKWLNKFRDENINYIELVDRYMAEDCEALGFIMDCGVAFKNKYGFHIGDNEALSRSIDQVTDIQALGSAIYSQWRYFNHWAYSAEEILEPQNREWFIIALSRLGWLAIRQLKLFKGIPQKVRIISNNIGYGPEPAPCDEVEQRITINAEGRVWFSAYNYGSGFEKHEKCRSRIFKMEKAAAVNVLTKLASYFSKDNIEQFVTDCGDWKMKITNTDGKTYVFDGPLCGGLEENLDELSNLIRQALNMDDLYVFDGKKFPCQNT